MIKAKPLHYWQDISLDEEKGKFVGRKWQTNQTLYSLDSDPKKEEIFICNDKFAIVKVMDTKASITLYSVISGEILCQLNVALTPGVEIKDFTVVAVGRYVASNVAGEWSAFNYEGNPTAIPELVETPTTNYSRYRQTAATYNPNAKDDESCILLNHDTFWDIGAKTAVSLVGDLARSIAIDLREASSTWDNNFIVNYFGGETYSFKRSGKLLARQVWKPTCLLLHCGLLFTAKGSSLKVWNPARLQQLYSISAEKAIDSIAFDNDRLAVLLKNEKLMVVHFKPSSGTTESQVEEDSAEKPPKRPKKKKSTK